MSDINEMVDPVEDVFDDNSNGELSDVDLGKLLAESKANKKAKAEAAAERINDDDINLHEELTPLQKAQLLKDKAPTGLVYSNQELEDGKNGPPSMDMVHTEARIDDFNKEMDEIDETLEKRKAVVIIKRPVKQEEYVQMMMEISSVRFGADGNAYFDRKDERGNKIPIEFCRIRTKDDPPFSENELNDNTIDNEGNIHYGKDTKKGTTPNNTKEAPVSNNVPSNNTNDNKDFDKVKETVKVIIDKTGLGVDFMFTDEEREKIRESEVIEINEVQTLDIESIKSNRSEKSFQDVLNEYDYSSSRTTICFPASGFKAQMKGMTYGEFSDIALSMENVNVDIYYKRLTVIYNKMTNISTGPFPDFETFLKSFAYTDIQLALYGLFVSTQAENEEIQLRCGNNNCRRTFDWKYATRSLIRLDRCSAVFLDKMKEIASADASSYDKIREESAVMKSKNIKLPDTGFIVELGIASAYDFLYNFIPLMDEDTFRQAFGQDVDEKFMNNILLLTSVRSVLVPDPVNDGKYIYCEGYKDILDAIYRISPREFKILEKYTADIQSDYEMVFSFGDVTCPHCGNITHNLDLSMDELVFQTYQLLMNTDVNLKTTPNSST